MRYVTLLGLFAAAVAWRQGCSSSGDTNTLELLNVSYDPTREAVA